MAVRERPTIGLSCYWRQATFGAWTLDAALVGQGYVEGVRLAGGRALVLPPDPEWIENPADAINLVDGLLLTGGEDIDPLLWAEEAHPANGVLSPRRDAVEQALLHCALEQGKPVLGICRGMQLINVALGGSLLQHMGEIVDQRPHREDDSTYGRHPITVVPGTKVSDMCEPGTVVHSHHHQTIGTIATGLIASAYAPDETIEAIELDSDRFCVGVLWHPDAADDPTGASVFSGLIEAARCTAVGPDARSPR